MNRTLVRLPSRFVINNSLRRVLQWPWAPQFGVAVGYPVSAGPNKRSRAMFARSRSRQRGEVLVGDGRLGAVTSGLLAQRFEVGRRHAVSLPGQLVEAHAQSGHAGRVQPQDRQPPPPRREGRA